MPHILHLTLLFITSLPCLCLSSGCPSGDWQLLDDMCYWMSDFSTTWAEAAEFCASELPGGGLASVHDLDTDAFIGEQVLNETQAWIGLRRNDEGHWQWSDGTPYDFSLWYDDEDDWVGGCATINNLALMGRWVGYSCDTSVQFVCQTAADV